MSHKRRDLRRLSPDLIAKARDDTATQVTRIMGTVFGAATMVSCLGMSAGPTVGGWIFDRFGSYAGMHFSSLAIGLGAVKVEALPAAEARSFGSLRMVMA
jgi:MFS family permease